VRRLSDEGHDVLNVDRAGEKSRSLVLVDLTDYGQVIDAVLGVDDPHTGFDAIDHLGAISAPGMRPRRRDLPQQHALHLQRVPGRPACQHQETRVRVERDTPGPAFRYRSALYSCGRGIPGKPGKHVFVGDASGGADGGPAGPVGSGADDHGSALLQRDVPGGCAAFPSFEAGAVLRKWNLWGHTDGRDGAQAVLRALENGKPGPESFIMAAADPVMSRSSAELAAEVLPGVEVVKEVGEREPLLSIDQARRMFGYAPEHSWRDRAGSRA